MAASITPAMIKELRERTGVGMGDCKKALEQADGDMELAISNLRKAGMASAVKKEGREAKEGMIATADSGHIVAFVEVSAETDFVLKNDRFKQFSDNIAHEVAKTNPSSLETFLRQKYSKEPNLTVDEYRATVVQAIGENIQIRRLKVLHKDSTHSIGVYSHMNGKIVTAVEIKGSGNEEALAKEIAMHIAASSPDYLDPADVPQEVLDNEREIAKVQVQGRPAFIMDKIIDGKLSAFYDARCLLRQKYIKDDSLSIADLVNKRGKEVGKPLAVAQFIRWNVGQ